MNSLPFVDTTSSCSGHLDKRAHHLLRTRVLARDYFLSSGYLSFQVDDRYVIVPEFMDRIQQEAGACPFSLFGQFETTTGIPTDNPDFEEVSKANAVELEAHLQYFGRYSSHYFYIIAHGIDLPFDRLDLAEERVRQFYPLWKSLTDICREFQRKPELHRMLSQE